MHDLVATLFSVGHHDVRRRALTAPLLPIRLCALNLTDGGRTLIDGVDLTLSRPGVTVIMGPNGAGKSLLLRLLHGLVAPTSGTITFCGRAPDEDIFRRQAMVFQVPVLLRRSVAANIDFVLRSRGRRDSDLRDRLLRRLDLADRAASPARRLSGGERQRLALARALATAPDLLLLDEPTASLDPASTLLIEALVSEAAESGVKVVFVTHDSGQARRLADEVVFLHDGRLAEHGAAESFFAGPSSRAARDYLAGRIVV